MKKWNCTILALAIVGMGTIGGRALAADEAASADAEKNWSVEVGYDYSSIYLFRGLDLLGGNNVSVPRVVVTLGNVSIYGYGYLGSVGVQSPRYEEVDLGADYTFTLAKDKLSLTFGGVRYGYGNTNSGSNTYEIYGIAALDVLLQPKLSVWRDVTALNGWFATFDLGHSFDLSKPLHMGENQAFSIDLLAEAGYDDGYVGPVLGQPSSGGQMANYVAGIDFPYQACKNFSIHAGAMHSFAAGAVDKLGQKSVTSYNFGATFSF